MGERGRRYKGDFEQFCADDYARIVDAVALVLGDPNVAVDAVNEALSRAWMRVLKGHDIDSIAGWVRVVALNIGRDDYRRRAMQRRHLPTLVSSRPSEMGSDDWGVSLDIRHAVEQLPARQREVAVLFYICDLPVAQIADELGISQGTVKSSLIKARSSLATALREVPEEVAHSDAG